MKQEYNMPEDGSKPAAEDHAERASTHLGRINKETWKMNANASKMTPKPLAVGEMWENPKGKIYLVTSVHGKVGSVPIATLDSYDLDTNEHHSHRRCWQCNKGWKLIGKSYEHNPEQDNA